MRNPPLSSQIPERSPAAPSAQPRSEVAAEFTPCLRLVTETILVDHGGDLGSDYREVETAVLYLSFDYGGVKISACDPRDRLQTPDGPPQLRDFAGEARARLTLESLGPVELDQLDSCASFGGQEPDYVVDVGGDLDALCGFSAQAVPRLRAGGWQVEIADDYHCRVADEVTWYADLQPPEDQDANWFELELGVDVDGRKVDLLPVLLELLQTSRGAGLQALLRRAKRWTAVPVGDSRFLAVPAERLQSILRVVRELYEVEGGGSGALRVPDLAPDYLEQLDDALGETPLELRGEVGLRGRQSSLGRDVPICPVPAPAELRATLRPYQQDGLDWLQHLRAHGASGILADDMGLGKTLQTIAHLVVEKAAGRLQRPALVVAPTSLVGNWWRELARFAPGLRALVLHGPRRRERFDQIDQVDVVITTYPLVLRDMEVFSQHTFSLEILDEAHTIKNVRSQIHQAAKAIDAELRLCITGTPLENNLDELWALFDFLMPGLLGTAQRFRSAFRTPIERSGDADRLETLRRRVAPFILRRMKDMVAKDLPAKTEIVRTVELSGNQRDFYESIRLAAHAAVRKVVKKKGIAASTIDILGALMKLRQVCCDPKLVSVPSARAVQESAKYEALMEMLEEMLPRGRRVLVFSQFTSMLSLIAEGLEQRGIRHVCLTGSTTDRQSMVDAFQQGRAEVFLISLKAGGSGLNLTRADTVIHYDPWWNPAAQAQATDRAYRIGQTRPVFVYNLIVAGSVEERMLGLQRRKRNLADSILSAGDPNLELTEDDVDDLFAPLSE